ncbi:MAG TPA: type II toxin-antitoxin system prevent-host-death family antitoxin [Thermoanaerobaculia bacterium]|nr:type II toxin-antitoxin system prevent-host-death family antitoxin [Thermoanaerobaculia bacterium]
MSSVSIADLKARLSHYVRLVRRGRTVTVTNREIPVARLVPLEEKRELLVVHRPEPGAPPPGKVKLPPPLKTKRDIVEVLLEERQSHR